MCLDAFSGELHFVLEEANKYDNIFGNTSAYKDIKDTLETSVSNVLLADEVHLGPCRTSRLERLC